MNLQGKQAAVQSTVQIANLNQQRFQQAYQPRAQAQPPPIFRAEDSQIRNYSQQYVGAYPQGSSPHEVTQTSIPTNGPQSQTATMYQTPQGAPRPNGPPRYTRPNMQTQPIPQRQPTMNLAGSPAPSQVFQPQMQTQMYMSNQNAPYMPQQGVVVQTGMPMIQGYQRAQLQQYQMPTSQAQYQVAQSSFYQPMVNQPTPAVYYPQGAVPMAQPARTGSAPGNPQAVYAKRERKAIPIIDPKTGRNINEDSGGESTPPAAASATVSPGTSVARSTPPQQMGITSRTTPVQNTTVSVTGKSQNVAEGLSDASIGQLHAPAAAAAAPENNEIAARFAAQVAAVIGGGGGRQDMMMEGGVDSPPNVQEAPELPMQQPYSAAAPSDQYVQPEPVATVITDSNITPEGSQSEEAVTKPVQIEQPPEQTIPPPQIDTVDAPVTKEIVKEATPPVESEPVKEVVPVVESVEKTVEPEPQEDMSSKEQESVTDTVVVPPVERERTPVSAEPEEVPKPESSSQTQSDAKPETVPEKVEEAPVIVEDSYVTEAVKEPTEAVKEPTPVPVEEAPSQPEVAPPVKSTPEPSQEEEGRGRRKSGSRQRSREGSARGEREPFERESHAEPLQARPPAMPNSDSTKPPPVPAPAPSEDVVPHVEIKVEDEVSSENHKNLAKTGDAPASSTEEKETEKQELKYEYKEDQWSPLNPEGKKQYDRSFLLTLQYVNDSVTKPEGLPVLPDVILDKPLVPGRSSHRDPYMRQGSVPDFTPGFIKPVNAKPGMGDRGDRGGGKRSSQQRDKARRVITHVSIQQDVKLHTAEQAWKPTHKDQIQATVNEPDKPDELLKKVRSILNKLTPQKFKKLMQQINDLRIDTQDRLVGTINLIFEKAIDEPSFSVAYANMCKCMSGAKVPREDKPDEFVTFRKILLNRCQKEFEKDKTAQLDIERMQQEIDEAPEDKKQLLEDEKVIAEMKTKRRTLGNIRFIGELFKLKMLTEAIMHSCLMKLIRSNDEDNLECLCRLLTTIGKELDHEKAKQRMDQYFAQMQKIVDQKRTCSRVRFMLQDIMELRLCNWVPRRADNNPKTIEEIHKEAQREAQEKQFQSQQAFTHKKQNRGPRFQGHQQPQGEDGWQAVGKARPQSIDPSKMKLTKPVQVDENNIQLGPPKAGGGFMGAWGKGSSGGGFRPSSQESDHPPTPSNRYQVLSGQGGDSYSDNRGRGAGRGMGRDQRGRGPSMSGQRGRHMARASQEHDREAALQAAKSLQTPGRQTPSGSRNQSRESSRNREMPPEKPALPAAKELSQAEMEQKSNSLLDEYLHVNDLKEAINCVRDLESPNSLHVFVYHALNKVIERSDKARKQVAHLLHDLVKQGHLTVEHYLKGLKEILEFAEDIAIDVPCIWKYLGDLIGNMVYDNTVPLRSIRDSLNHLVQCNKAGEVMAFVLHNVAHNMGHIKVGDLWKASGLKWSDFLPQSENVQAFVNAKKLEFTLDQEPRSPDANTAMPMEKISWHLDQLIVERGMENEDIFDWIAANVPDSRAKEPAFIRALMTSVCTSAIKNGGGVRNCKMEEPQIQKRSVLLQKYLDHKAELELQALYALQALVHKLEHPPGLLRQFFDTLYDEDVISEDAFNQWEASQDPAEQAGKALAQKSVVQFFTWLREADEEES